MVERTLVLEEGLSATGLHSELRRLKQELIRNRLLVPPHLPFTNSHPPERACSGVKDNVQCVIEVAIGD